MQLIGISFSQVTYATSIYIHLSRRSIQSLDNNRHGLIW